MHLSLTSLRHTSPAYWVVLLLAGLVVLDVSYWIGLDIAARLGWLPDTAWGRSWETYFRSAPLWLEAVYFTGFILILAGFADLLQRRARSAWLITAGILLERVDWMTSAGDIALSEMSQIGNLELILQIACIFAVILIPRPGDFLPRA